ncbi:unnamed protein product [Gadus morhua 'NCC']
MTWEVIGGCGWPGDKSGQAEGSYILETHTGEPLLLLRRRQAVSRRSAAPRHIIKNDKWRPNQPLPEVADCRLMFLNASAPCICPSSSAAPLPRAELSFL